MVSAASDLGLARVTTEAERGQVDEVDAVTKIQAAHRGKEARKQVAYKKPAKRVRPRSADAPGCIQGSRLVALTGGWMTRTREFGCSVFVGRGIRAGFDAFRVHRR